MSCVSLKDSNVVVHADCDRIVRDRHNGSVIKAVVTQATYNLYKNEFRYLLNNSLTASLVMAIMNLGYASGLHPWILATQAFKESRYRWQVMVSSGSDAKGLFQFLGDTWMDPVKIVAREYSVNLQFNIDVYKNLYYAYNSRGPDLDSKYKVLEEFEILSGFYRVVAPWNVAGGIAYQRLIFTNFRYLNNGLYFRTIMSHYCGLQFNCNENPHYFDAVPYAVDVLGNAVKALVDVWVEKFGEDPRKWPKAKWPAFSDYNQNKVFRKYSVSRLPSFQQMLGYNAIWSKLGISSPHIYTFQESVDLGNQKIPALSYVEAIEKRKSADIVYNVSLHPAPYYDSGVTIRDFNPITMIPSEYA